MTDSNGADRPTLPTMSGPPKVAESPYATPQASFDQPRPVLGGGEYTIGEIVGIAWNGFTARIGIALGTAALFLFIQGVGSNVPILNLIYTIAVSFPLQAGSVLIAIKLADAGLGRNPTIEVGDLFTGFSKYGSTMGAGWLIVAVLGVPAGILSAAVIGIGAAVGRDAGQIIMVAGIAVIMVPVVYVALRLMFVFMLIMDQNMGAVESIKQSWALTHGHVLNLFVIGLLAGAVTLVGLLLLVVGVIPAAAFVWGMMGAVYRKITAT
jgi:hypothetical protein